MFRVLFLSGLLSLLLACQSNQATLYQQIGGQQGNEKLVDAFINQIGNDPSTLAFFKHSSVTHFRAGFLAHLCDVLDGPCEYRGDNMVAIHKGMNIREADFNRVVELMIAAMDEVEIATPIQNQILARLAPMRGEIIKH